MFRSLLIANRGEIACRILRTARRMGLRTIAVYSEAEADGGTLHVQMADEAVLLGPAPARESYLSIERILDAARRTGAEAIHPGYGFLSENAAFAEACASAGLIFVGPPAAAIRAMGLKAEAKALMAAAGVPTVPGYAGAAQDDATLAEAAAAIGFPVLIKPSAGGGGKGMRRVDAAADLPAALAAARREAEGAFGNARLLLEKFVEHGRHVEVQVFGDRLGDVVTLFDRDCSLQRRHQKVIEEAPAPGLDTELRRAMAEAAERAARAVAYQNAGTIEFLLAPDGTFYFLEMNTRLQVEHPVTEMVTGLDLVEWQLRIAAGEPVPRAAGEVHLHGHAIEARIYAEDPARGFLPAAGYLARFRGPHQTADLRVDGWVRDGDTVPVHYDPLLAKVVVHGADRPRAVARLREALGEFEIAGVKTNLAFLQALAATEAFAAGAVDIGFIDRNLEELVAAPELPPDEVLALAAAYLLLAHAQRRDQPHPWDPWAAKDSWRLNRPAVSTVPLGAGEQTIEVRAEHLRSGERRADLRLELHGRALTVRARLHDLDGIQAEIDGRRRRATAVLAPEHLTLFFEGASWQLRTEAGLEEGSAATPAPSGLSAPMPGRVAQVLVAPGEKVKRGQVLLILEAMKMEHAIAAPGDGVVGAVLHRAGDIVPEGAPLVRFEGTD